jgi:Fe-S-cluster-containing hydrogenase component 2
MNKPINKFNKQLNLVTKFIRQLQEFSTNSPDYNIAIKIFTFNNYTEDLNKGGFILLDEDYHLPLLQPSKSEITNLSGVIDVISNQITDNKENKEYKVVLFTNGEFDLLGTDLNKIIGEISKIKEDTANKEVTYASICCNDKISKELKSLTTDKTFLSSEEAIVTKLRYSVTNQQLNSILDNVEINPELTLRIDNKLCHENTCNHECVNSCELRCLKIVNNEAIINTKWCISCGSCLKACSKKAISVISVDESINTERSN